MINEEAGYIVFLEGEREKVGGLARSTRRGELEERQRKIKIGKRER